MTGLKWTYRTTQKVAEELGHLGIEVSARTGGRLLKDMGFALRVTHTTIARDSVPDRGPDAEEEAVGGQISAEREAKRRSA